MMVRRTSSSLLDLVSALTIFKTLLVPREGRITARQDPGGLVRRTGFLRRRRCGATMAAGQEFTETSLEGRAHTLREAMDCARVLHEMPKPTIAMVRGAAAGAGLSLALSCDLRVASTSARLVTAFKDVAYSGDFGGSYFLTHLVGPSKAKELYFLSERLDAERAHSLGLVNFVFPDDELLDQTKAIAAKLAAGPRIADCGCLLNIFGCVGASFPVSSW